MQALQYTVYGVANGDLTTPKAIFNSKHEVLEYLGISKFNFPTRERVQTVHKNLLPYAKAIVHMTNYTVVCRDDMNKVKDF